MRNPTLFRKDSANVWNHQKFQLFLSLPCVHRNEPRPYNTLWDHHEGTNPYLLVQGRVDVGRRGRYSTSLGRGCLKICIRVCICVDIYVVIDYSVLCALLLFKLRNKNNNTSVKQLYINIYSIHVCYMLGWELPLQGCWLVTSKMPCFGIPSYTDSLDIPTGRRGCIPVVDCWDEDYIQL